jgi:hypothetical protein
MFAPNWSAKAEYLRYDFDSHFYSTALTEFCTGAPCPVNGGLFASTAGITSFRYAGNVVRFGLNYKFGYAAAPVVYR